MKLPYNKIVHSEEETIKIADSFSSIIHASDVVSFIGNLGSGKTFFIKHLLKNFKIEGVNSPTFAIVNQYNGEIKINHFDFYRINKINELYDLGFEDYLNMNDAVTLIEWADLLPEILPQRRFEISIRILGDYDREITIKKYE